MNSTSLSRLFRPASLAVVGASDDARSVGGLVLANLANLGYPGELHLVSRSRDSVNGQACVKSIDALPEGIDAAVLVVPHQAVADSIASCARRGIGGAVVFASGFSEMGPAGIAEQRKLAALAADCGVALLGPNCMGFVNYTQRAPLTFEALALRTPTAGPKVGVIAQSGAMNANIRQALNAKGVDVAFSVSTGNEAVLGAEDVLGYLVDADDVQAFAIFVESIRHPAAFLEAADRARAAGKPVVLMHAGRSARARQAAQSHTGALAGEYGVMRAMVERHGVVVVDTMDELFDTTAILVRYPAPVSQPGTALASNSGALRGVSLDFCDPIGLEFAGIGEATLDRLKQALPDFATPDNPLDLTSQGMQQPELFGIAASALLDDPAVGTLLVPLMGGSPKQQVAKAEHLLPAVKGQRKPVAVIYMGDDAPLGEAFLEMVRDSGVPFFRSPERAMRAMANVHRYGRLIRDACRSADAASIVRLDPHPDGPIAEYKGKRILKALGIAIPNGALATSPDEAAEIATRIGYPVVLKAQADRLTHKSDVGGVAVAIRDEGALREAWRRIYHDVAAALPDMALDGVLVEQMAAPGVEMVVGARRDAAWGVVMMVGLGGIWIEALKDVRLLAADLSDAQIEDELRRLKGVALLTGLRGRAAVDLRELAGAVSRLAAFMLANPQIVELDINPLLARPAGEGMSALDAVFVVQHPAPGPQGNGQANNCGTDAAALANS